jgi:RNA polymerase sigma-70 factor (ECF subfamily)
MDQENWNQRLSRISTLWTLVRQAHQEPGEEVRSAQSKLLERYSGAIRRYLLGALHNSDAADEVFQDFACRFLRGGLQGADPERGKFRAFLKGVLIHMVADHLKKQRRQLPNLPADHAEPSVEDSYFEEADRAFVTSWRDDLLARSWSALEQFEKQTGQHYYSVLRFRASHPDLRSQEMADQLAAQIGKPLTAPGVRQLLHRAREKFAELILQEVLDSIENPSAGQVEEELAELGLLEYCRPYLQPHASGE